MKTALITTSLISALAVTPALTANAQTPRSVNANAIFSTSATPSNAFNQFTPRPSQDTRLDFSVWDDMLQNMVFYTGPSLRKRASRPAHETGTRITFGHTSPYRMEGNRVAFEGMVDETIGIVGDYVDDLVKIANDVDIATLPRNDQLAFWFNLHNAIVVEAISEAYPVKRPSRIKAEDGSLFHDTNRVTINGVQLSLRNIREDIVYANWNDPLVIYGFFHGDIGSPSLQRKAFSRSNVAETLKFSGREFANSLRGVTAFGDLPRISRVYEDAAPYFFDDLNSGYRTHMAGLANTKVAEILADATMPVKVARYEEAIADITYGDNDRIDLYNTVLLTDYGVEPDFSTIMTRQMDEYLQKIVTLRARGMLSTVTIEDIETVDPSDFGSRSGPQSIEMGPLHSNDGVDTGDEIIIDE